MFATKSTKFNTAPTQKTIQERPPGTEFDILPPQEPKKEQKKAKVAIKSEQTKGKLSSKKKIVEMVAFVGR